MTSLHRCYILGLGHPRTGTRYTKELLCSLGLDIGHEKVGRHGIIAWPLVATEGPWPFVTETNDEGVIPQRTIYNVRSPHQSIPSIVYTDDRTEKSANWRNNFLGMPYRSQFENPVEYAIVSLLVFDRLILQREPDLIFRIEDQTHRLVNMVRNDRMARRTIYTDPGVVNKREHDDWGSLSEYYDTVCDDLREGINDYCVRYGYDKLF